MPRFRSLGAALAVSTAALVLCLGAAAPAAQADLGQPFATASAVCDPSTEDSAEADTTPVSTAHSSVIVQVQVSGGSGSDDAVGNLSDGDVGWGYYGSIAANSTAS